MDHFQQNLNVKMMYHLELLLYELLRQLPVVANHYFHHNMSQIEGKKCKIGLSEKYKIILRDLDDMKDLIKFNFLDLRLVFGLLVT